MLDGHYQTFPLSRRSPEQAVYSLLAAFDATLICFRILTPNSQRGVIDTDKQVLDGLTQALRWAHPRLTPGADLERVRSEDRVSEAGMFLLWAARYELIAIMHRQFGRGLVGVQADDVGKIIRFTRSEVDLPEPFGFRFRDLVEADRVKLRRTSGSQGARIKRIGRTARDEARFDGGIVFDDPSSLLARIHDAVEKVLVASYHEEVPLDDAADLGGFQMGHLRRFWRALYGWSIAALNLYLAMFDAGADQMECLPTQRVPLDQFQRVIGHASGLDAPLVGAITKRLTYGAETTRPDPFLQPLFVGRHAVAWSPTLIQLTRFERNALKLMCRMKRLERLGATLNGEREDGLLRQAVTLLRGGGYSVFHLNQEIKADNEEGEIDLLAHTPAVPDEVLLIQAKAGIAADEINEVAEATKEMQVGQEQAERCARILSKMSEQSKSERFPGIDWNLVRSVQGLVITPESEPNSRLDASRVPAISLVALRHRLRPEELSPPSGLANKCRTRPWLVGIAETEEAYVAEKVADMTYHIPCYPRLDVEAATGT